MCQRLFETIRKMAKKLNYNKEYFRERDSLNPLLAQSIKILAKENNLKTILDVGCGTGRLVHFLNKNSYQAYGCDTAKEAISLAKKINQDSKIKWGQASQLPYKNDSFDLITSISVIEHLTKTQVQKFLSEATRVLKSGGFIFFVTPNFSSPARLLFGKKWFAYKDPTHINFFTPKSLKLLLAKYGFKNVKFRHKSAYNAPFVWYLPLPLRKLPMPVKNCLNYLMISSPLATFRDSLWVSARK